ncbi:uncharacterized protein V6R79_009455 [Siganus canaliculatus]
MKRTTTVTQRLIITASLKGKMRELSCEVLLLRRQKTHLTALPVLFSLGGKLKNVHYKHHEYAL